ncbi:unnamed protein product [Dicrocoelium dendriticum]|nr:unnamed protein product [Dicrocoelium dendriticum]
MQQARYDYSGPLQGPQNRVSNVNYFLLALSCISWVSGCVSVAVGIYESFYASHRIVRFYNASKLFPVAVVIGVSGCSLHILNTVGCLGVLKKSKSLLLWYGVCTLIVCLFYIGCGIWAAKYYAQVELDVSAMMTKLVQRYDESKLLVDDDTKFLNLLHFKLQCCGKNGVSDFNGRKPILSCGVDPHKRQGCLPVLKATIHAGLFRIATMGFSGALLHAFIAIVAFMVSCWTRKTGNV